jgi:hypothetical protein
MIEFVSWTAVVWVIATSIGLLLSRSWRLSLLLLAAQSLAVFWLVRLHWPLSMAAVKLITGWMAAAALGMTRTGLHHSQEASEQSWPEGGVFRGIAAAAVLVVTLSAVPVATAYFPGMQTPVMAGGLVLMGMGILHLGITAQPMRVTIGLLTVFSGFEIVYAALEGSILVAALLATIDLGVALVGAYLLTAAPTEAA